MKRAILCLFLWHKCINECVAVFWRPKVHLGVSEEVSDTKGVIVVTLVVALCLTILTLPWLYKSLRYCIPKLEPLNQEPEEQFMLHLCTESNAKYEYEIIFRVGCPTPHFDLKRAYIDFEIKVDPPHSKSNPRSAGDVTFGRATRFQCAKLSDSVCGEMHLLIGSQVPIGQIVGIQAHHNDKHGTIFLYEYVLMNLSTDTLLEVGRIEQYLTTKRTTYRAKLRCNNQGQDEMGLFPRLPLIWDYTELAIIICVLLLLNATCTLVFEQFNLCPFNRDQKGSLYRCLFIVVCVTPINVACLTLITLCYKYYLKRKAQQFEYAVFDEGSVCWRLASLLYLAVLVALSLAMAAVVVYLALKTTLVQSLYWFASWLVVTVCVLGTWIVANTSLWFSGIFDQTTVKQAHQVQSMEKRMRHKGSKVVHTVYATTSGDKPGRTAYYTVDPNHRRTTITTKADSTNKRHSKRRHSDPRNSVPQPITTGNITHRLFNPKIKLNLSSTKKNHHAPRHNQSV